MSAFVATTTIAVLDRAETEDSYGDPVSSSVIVASGIPAHLYQQSQRVFDPSTGRFTTVTGFGIRVRSGAFDFTANDRVKDERTGLVYSVDSATTTTSPAMAGDVQLTAKRVS